MAVETKQAHILLVEDDDVDAEGIVRGLKKAKILNPIVRAYDGMDALEQLRGEGGKDRVPRPYIIFLDLRMPRMDGHNFLEEIRKDPKLKKSVIFVLTTSKDEVDKERAYEKYVAGYILKQNVGEEFMNLIKMLHSYWRIVELPNEG